jgi:hypothetical protein
MKRYTQTTLYEYFPEIFSDETEEFAKYIERFASLSNPDDPSVILELLLEDDEPTQELFEKWYVQQKFIETAKARASLIERMALHRVKKVLTCQTMLFEEPYEK